MINMFQNKPIANKIHQDDSAVLFTPPELAAYLGIGRNLAYQLLNDGVIKGFKLGRSWKVSKDVVDMYIAKQSHLI